MSATAPKPEQTADDFLRTVRASELVEPTRMPEVETAVAPWKSAPGPMPEACIRALVDRDLLTAWQIGKLREGTSGGFFLGKCKLLQPLGKGAMGSVYLAEHTTLRSRVAVKVLRMMPQRGSGKQDEQRDRFESHVRRFEQEARAAFRLNHPNIARAIDLDTCEDPKRFVVNFIVMDFIDGSDLEKRVQLSGGLDVREAADYIRQAAAGLQYAHDEGLVHRDIKPANLMVDARGHLKILDLGLAQIDNPEGDEDTSITHEFGTKVLGTPDYMSPEQTSGTRNDHRSDIYSLGCTFYYLLAGHAPFETATAAAGIDKRKARMLAHRKTPAPNVLDVRPDVPVEIVELILRMMEKSPEARPQSAQEVAESLTAWLATTAGSPATQAGPRRRAAARRPPDTPRRSAAGGDSASGPRPTSAGHGGQDAPPATAHASWSGSDAHALSHSDAVRLSSQARSTGSMPAETVPDSSAFGGESISIDTTARPGKTAAAQRRPVVAAAAPVSTVTASPAATPATAAGARAWLVRRVAAAPLLIWLGIAAVILATMLTALGWWLLRGPAVETDEDLEMPPPVVEKSPPAATKPRPRTDVRQNKPSPRPRPTPKADREPGPLDNIMPRTKPAEPAEPTDAAAGT